MRGIGVVGLGVVGGAFYKALKAFATCPVYGIDKDPARAIDGFPDMVANADVVFLCLPTLTREDGTQDQEALNEVCAHLDASDYRGVVCVRSTVLPGTTRRLGIEYDLHVAHCPEFLTAAQPLVDTLEQEYHMVGADDDRVAETVAEAIEMIPTVKACAFTSAPETTELAKYMHNLYLATKVGFFNAMHEYATAAGLNFHRARAVMLHCTKATQANHTRVPGPDGRFGYGGMCFPKDTTALATEMRRRGIPCEQLDATIKANERQRARKE